MMRGALKRTIAYCGAAVLTAIVLQRDYASGPPYLRTRTVLDHVWQGHHPQRNELIVVPELAKLIPRGATVTCFHPRDGVYSNDDASYFTAIALMPDHDLLPPLTASPDRQNGELVEYVITLDQPMTHPAYELVATVEHGWLYKRR